MPKIAHAESRDDAAERGAGELTRIARATTERGADATRDGIERARALTADATEAQRQTVQRSADETAELGRTVVDLLGEQTRDNMQAAAALGRAVNWAEVAQVQRELIGSSFARMNRLGERYRAMMQAGMKSMAFPSRH